MDTAKTPEEKFKGLVEFRTAYHKADREARRNIAAENERQPVLVYDGEESLRAADYLVGGVIPEEGAGELFGESDVGKTFVSTSIAVHVAAGKAWFGRAVKAGSVLFCEAEGGAAFSLRKHAAKAAAGIAEGERLPFVTIYESLGFGPDTDPALAVAKATLLRESLAQRGLPPIRLVVVDTLSQNMHGDADNNSDMQAFLRVFRAFLKALSAEPVFGLLLHHPGHENKKRGRGAYALGADLDLIMHLEGTKEGLTLRCARMRDDSPFADIPLRLEPRVVTVNGKPLYDRYGTEKSTLVLVERKTQPGERPPMDEVKAAVLASLPAHPKKCKSQGELVAKVSAVLKRNVSKATVDRYCEELLADGLAEAAPGRQANSLIWGQAPPRQETASEM
jgi:hypothetical protein